MLRFYLRIQQFSGEEAVEVLGPEPSQLTGTRRRIDPGYRA